MLQYNNNNIKINKGKFLFKNYFFIKLLRFMLKKGFYGKLISLILKSFFNIKCHYLKASKYFFFKTRVNDDKTKWKTAFFYKFQKQFFTTLSNFDTIYTKILAKKLVPKIKLKKTKYIIFQNNKKES